MCMEKHRQLKQHSLHDWRIQCNGMVAQSAVFLEGQRFCFTLYVSCLDVYSSIYNVDDHFSSTRVT